MSESPSIPQRSETTRNNKGRDIGPRYRVDESSALAYFGFQKLPAGNRPELAFSHRALDVKSEPGGCSHLNENREDR